MKRVFTIVALTVLATCPSFGQLGSIGGNVSYVHQYSEDAFNGKLSTTQSRNPTIDLQGSGIILTREIAEFEFQSYFTQNSFTSKALGPTLDYQTQNWNIYRLNLSLIQFSPCWVLLRANDGYVRSHSAYGDEFGSVGRVRSQSQEMTVSLRRITFLPTITFDFNRSHAWATEGFVTDNKIQSYAVAAAASNGSTTFNVSGQNTRTEDLISGSVNRFSSVGLNGTKSFDETHFVSIHSEYTWFESTGMLFGNLSYTGPLSNSMTMTTGLNLSQATSPFSTTTNVSVSGNVTQTLSQEWRYTANLGEQYNKQVVPLAVTPVETRNTWRTGGTLSHQQAFGVSSMSNSFSLSGEWARNREQSGSYGLGFGNGYSTKFRDASVQIGQSSSFSVQRRGSEKQFRAVHRVNLGADTRLMERISNKTDISFSSNRSQGEIEGAYSTRSVMFTDALYGGFTYIIPFTIGAGFSSTWYFGDVNGKAYGWNGTFNSGRFFTDRLSFRYRYSRRYDVNYRAETVEQTAQFHYGWRVMDLSLSFFERRLGSRQRTITFAVSRPF